MTSNKESVIKDKVMDERGPVPDSTWAQLQIRGSGTQVNDALTRWGWSRDQLVVTPVIITEPSSGKVMGSKWEVRGKVAKYTINATTLWNDANKNVAVHVDLEGESFKFSNRGTGVPANFSDWRDLRQGNLLRFQEGEEEVGWDELMERQSCRRMCKTRNTHRQFEGGCTIPYLVPIVTGGHKGKM